jgi:hypothetical protein
MNVIQYVLCRRLQASSRRLVEGTQVLEGTALALLEIALSFAADTTRAFGLAASIGTWISEIDGARNWGESCGGNRCTRALPLLTANRFCIMNDIHYRPTRSKTAAGNKFGKETGA